MSGLRAVTHVGVQVGDLERSLAFYRDLLGLEVIRSAVIREPYVGELTGHPGAELHVALLRLPQTDVILEIAEYQKTRRRPIEAATADPGNAHVGFEVEDIVVLRDRLVRAGARALSDIIVPTVGPNKGAKAVYVCDPDGFRVELLERRRVS